MLVPVLIHFVLSCISVISGTSSYKLAHLQARLNLPVTKERKPKQLFNEEYDFIHFKRLCIQDKAEPSNFCMFES